MGAIGVSENHATTNDPGFVNWIVARRVAAFRCASENRSLVKRIASTFVSGFRDTIVKGDSSASIRHVESTSEDFLKPFYVEGASLALAASRALPMFKASSGPQDLLYHLPGFKHVIYAGWGWWNAFMPRPARSFQDSIEASDIFSVLTIDGTAFARAFLFARPPYFDLKIPTVSNEMKRVWVQGYGRALWFLGTADCSIIERQRNRLGKGLSADLDAGLGLASAFAGMASSTTSFSRAIYADKSAFLQGYAFGLTARAMSTPEVFSNWLLAQPPAGKQNIQRLVSKCLVEPRTNHGCVTKVYTSWQDELRREFKQNEVTG